MDKGKQQYIGQLFKNAMVCFVDWSRTATNNTKKLQPLVQAISLSSTSNSSLQSNSSLFLVQEYGKHPKMNGAYG